MDNSEKTNIKMKIDDHFTLEQDSNQFILKFEQACGWDDDKKKYLLNNQRWYYPTLKDALKGYVQKSVPVLSKSEESVLDAQSIIDKIEQSEKNIEKFLKQYKK